MTKDNKLKTVNLQGKEYAQVAERVKAFREKFPNSKIITKNVFTETGGTEFNTYVWRDRKDYISGDLDSADSTGTARGVTGKTQKDFEKLETISVGRALALLGFLSSGEVASFEEMEQYYADKEAERKLYIQGQVDLFDQAKNMDELKDLWSKTTKTEPDIVAAKDKRKAELESMTIVGPKQTFKPSKKEVVTSVEDGGTGKDIPFKQTDDQLVGGQDANN